MTPEQQQQGVRQVAEAGYDAKRQMIDRLKKTAGAADPRLSRKATWPLRDIGSHLN